MGLVKTRRLMAMQKQQRAKARMRPPKKYGAKNGTWPAAPIFPSNLAKSGVGGMQTGVTQSIQNIPKN